MSTPHDPAPENASENAHGSVLSAGLSAVPSVRPVHATEADGTLEFDIRPTELDSFGHVNNARYLEFLEWARAEWGRVRGLSYDKFREEGQISGSGGGQAPFSGRIQAGRSAADCLHPGA